MLAVPAFVPLTDHWYVGDVPSLTGVAVRFTVLPSHTSLSSAAIDTLTGRLGYTVIVTGSDVAGLPVAQGSLEVSDTVIESPFVGM